MLLGVFAASCTSAAEHAARPPEPTPEAASPDVLPTVAQIVAPAVPTVVAVVPPDISELNAAGEVVAASIGDLISPSDGVDVVGDDCTAEGGEPTYRGTSGTDIFDIGDDGSGVVYDDTPAGLMTLSIAADGSGEYYDDTGGELLTISAHPDGSGEYYRETIDALTTVEVAADGSGEFYRSVGERILTVTLTGDGAGRLVDESPERTVTIDAAGDGAGQYVRRRGDTVITIDKQRDGAWELSETAPTRRVTLRVDADGSGTYDEAGRTPIQFAFDSDGNSVEGHRIVLPPSPEFAVADGFAPVGTLGSLEPPCTTVIRLDAQVLFDYDDATLRVEAGPVLDEVVDVLASSGRPIEIIGHTASIGPDDYNLELSLERAQSVEAALRQRGLAVDMTVDGRGETEPVVPNELPDGTDDPAGRAQNRRVDIRLVGDS